MGLSLKAEKMTKTAPDAVQNFQCHSKCAKDVFFIDYDDNR